MQIVSSNVTAILLGLSLILPNRDALSECKSALAAAKKVGLPLSTTELHPAKPTTESIKLEKLIQQADKILKRNQPGLSTSVAIDMENLKRKKQGMPPLPYPEESDKQKASRIKDVLAVIDQIGHTKGPRIVRVDAKNVGDFLSGAAMKNLLTYELEDIEKSARNGRKDQVVKKLRTARRLVDITPTACTVIAILTQNASEARYYASIQKLAKQYPKTVHGLPGELTAKFAKPTFEQVLREEFFRTLCLFASLDKKGNIVPKQDADSLAITSKHLRSWTIAYPALKSAKSGKEIEARYKLIEPKMSTYKFGDDDEMTLGPDWARYASKLEGSEARRLELLKALKSL